jgi:hypothetical protein
MTTVDFYRWRENVVGSLLGLSDTRYQRLVWTGVIASSENTPDEMLCTLVDDWAFFSFSAENRACLNAEQINSSSALMRAIRAYQETEPDFDGDVDRMLKNDAWLSVVEAARTLYVVLCPNRQT